MERTAMQILIQHMKDYPQFGWYDKATELLALEREQIIEARQDGLNQEYAHGAYNIPEKSDDDYFTQKYGDGSK